MPKMYTLRQLGACPDPDKYIRVKVGKLYYWRKKRGTVNPAVLNEAMQANANNTAITNKAAKEIIQKLAPFLERLIVKRPLANIGGRLKKGINANGKLEYSFLKGYEIQEAYPLKSMLRINFPFSVANDMVSVAIDLNQFSVKH